MPPTSSAPPGCSRRCSARTTHRAPRRRDPRRGAPRRRAQPRDRPPARGDLRHAVRPRGHPRLISGLDDVLDSSRRSPTRSSCTASRRRPPSPSSRRRSSSASASSSTRRSRNLRGFKGLEKYWIEVHRLENEGDQLARQGDRRPLRGRRRPDRAHQVEGHLRAPRDHDRQVRGRRQHHRADHHQARLRAITAAIGYLVVLPRGRLRLHQRLPRRRQRHRHVGLHGGAAPAPRHPVAAVGELRRRADRARRSPPTIAQGIVDDPDGHEAVVVAAA